jgi:hypothetical protein
VVEKQWFGCHDGWTLPQFWLKNQNCCPLPAEFSTDLSTQSRLLQDLQLMDPNHHQWGVSSESGWLRSNGLDVMVGSVRKKLNFKVRVGYLDFSKSLIIWSSALLIFAKLAKFELEICLTQELELSSFFVF